GEEVTLKGTVADVARRDEQDEQREHAPLRRAPDAVEIDSSRLSIEQVLELMMGKVKETLKAEG
ncbi:MAG TPA: (d)CMP kinase, partial [Geobacteraceae bacterium]|nr:(d)CMP kinase [Geobacteraceae bacterium]